MKKIIVCLLILGTSAVYLPKAQAQMFFMENDLVGKTAPEFTLEKVAGGNQSLTDFRQGKNMIIFFWATWCPHCREELTVMNKRIEELTKKGIKIAAVDLGEKLEIVKSFVQKNAVKMEVFIDEESSLEEPYGIIGVPTLFFINQEGVVKAVKHSLPADVEKLFMTNSVPTQ